MTGSVFSRAGDDVEPKPAEFGWDQVWNGVNRRRGGDDAQHAVMVDEHRSRIPRVVDAVQRVGEARQHVDVLFPTGRRVISPAAPGGAQSRDQPASISAPVAALPLAPVAFSKPARDTVTSYVGAMIAAVRVARRDRSCRRRAGAKLS